MSRNDDDTTAGSSRPMGGFLSWTFRGFETFVLVVALAPILDSLVSPIYGPSIPFYAGVALGATLLGWALGGAVRTLTVGLVGRRNTATYSVLGTRSSRG